MKTISLKDEGDRVTVVLDRPAVRNAIDDDMVAELHAVCDDLEVAPRILITTGEPSGGRGV
ncbi:MAG: enoyl-CoA hydratase/isomerase family protein, partial [Propionibacteriaceae bacterium]